MFAVILSIWRKTKYWKWSDSGCFTFKCRHGTIAWTEPLYSAGSQDRELYHLCLGYPQNNMQKKHISFTHSAICIQDNATKDYIIFLWRPSIVANELLGNWVKVSITCSLPPQHPPFFKVSLTMTSQISAITNNKKKRHIFFLNVLYVQSPILPSMPNYFVYNFSFSGIFLMAGCQGLFQKGIFGPDICELYYQFCFIEECRYEIIDS